jgi:hypothetical protein
MGENPPAAGARSGDAEMRRAPVDWGQTCYSANEGSDAGFMQRERRQRLAIADWASLRLVSRTGPREFQLNTVPEGPGAATAAANTRRFQCRIEGKRADWNDEPSVMNKTLKNISDI